jgi:hyaluronoglucosaminidase
MFGVYPRPKTCEPVDTVVFPEGGMLLYAPADLRAMAERTVLPAFRKARIPYRWAATEEAGYPVHIGTQPDHADGLPDISDLGDEAYAVRVTDAGASVTANSSRGIFHGLLTLSGMADKEGLHCGTIIDHPSMAIRGVVEGFFGRPYSDDERLDLVEYIGRLKMNTYLYGPKDDPYHRVRWREMYSAARMTTFVELADRAHQYGVDFGWAAGPGFTVRYSDEQDVAAMIDKFAQLVDVGVRLFAIFYDDIFPQMQYPEDRAAFDSLAEAQGVFTTRVWDRMRELWPEARLMVCPTEYRGDGDSDYVVELGGSVPDEIPLFWTGPDVCSSTITADNARALTEHMGRQPVYWDNYPVNDASMVFDLHVGPLRGRDAGLGDLCRGIMFNPMNFAESSKIPLFTAADYTWNAEGYDPEESWRAALRHVDKMCAADWELVFDHMRKSCLADSDAPGLDALIATYNEQCKSGEASVKMFGVHFAGMIAAAETVLGRTANRKLAHEAAPWVNRLHGLTSLTDDVVRVLAMATGEETFDLEIVKRMRRHVMRDIDSLRERFLPHVGHRSIETLALRAMRVSEDMVRGDMDAAREAMKEPFVNVNW